MPSFFIIIFFFFIIIIFFFDILFIEFMLPSVDGEATLAELLAGICGWDICAEAVATADRAMAAAQAVVRMVFLMKVSCLR
jgi:hypothetical protein